MTNIHTGQTKRIVNKKKLKKVPFNVPQFVNSSLTTCLGTIHPKNIQVRKPPIGKKICPVTKSKTSNNGFPKKDKPLQFPNDNEQIEPITKVEIVTINAPFLRLICNSSYKKAVLTS